MDKVVIMRVKDEKYMQNCSQNPEGAIWNDSIKKNLKYFSECSYGLVLRGSGQRPMAIRCEHSSGLIKGKEFLD